MDSKHVLLFLEDVASVSGNAKKELLATRKDDECLIRVLKAANDPMITYGIKDLPDPTTIGGNNFTLAPGQSTMRGCFVAALLKMLADRTLTGNDAKSAIVRTFNLLTAESQTLLRRILLKDLRAGFNVSTTNKVFGNIIPTFDCMLAHKYEEKRIKEFPVAVEPKIDGMRVICIASETSAEFFTRSGHVVTTLDHVKTDVMDIAKRAGFKMVLDGEATSGKNFNESISALRKKDEEASEAVFTVFDIITYNEWEAEDVKPNCQARRNRLELLLDNETYPNIALIEQRVLNSHDEIMAFYQEVKDAGGEGVIVKPLDGHYERKRSYSWMKIKGQETADCLVVGVFEGTGKYENSLGGLIVLHKGVEVRVGGGFTDDERDSLWRLYKHLDGTIAETAINRLIEVEYHEETPDGSLRHPRFIRFRDDKPVEEAA